MSIDNAELTAEEWANELAWFEYDASQREEALAIRGRIEAERETGLNAGDLKRMLMGA